jgi:homoserine kinase type II
MAAFTTFSEEALARYLVMFDRGVLDSWTPISGGIENSNYFVRLNEGGYTYEYVLTIIEDLSYEEVPFFNKLLQRLHHYGLPVPAPQATLDGMTSTSFCGKPAVLFQRLRGEHLDRATEEHCHAIGRFLAESHQVLSSLDDRRANPYPGNWMHKTLSEVGDRLSADEIELLSEQIERYRKLEAMELPSGLIHGDLFLDNALFEDNALSGVIDYYHACHDLLIQDLAIAINDWCRDTDGAPEPSLETALIAGYESFRELTTAETAALPDLKKTSAARFVLTRLLSGDPPLKDPHQMLALLHAL